MAKNENFRSRDFSSTQAGLLIDRSVAVHETRNPQLFSTPNFSSLCALQTFFNPFVTEAKHLRHTGKFENN